MRTRYKDNTNILQPLNSNRKVDTAYDTKNTHIPDTYCCNVLFTSLADHGISPH